ncbi:MAG TPA: tetratricopeptide repeat protein [Flavobacteriaceae bacterium]|nr:tetratricopeptide repeat protein [Flavobacteriaceae bacterium]
MAKNYFEQGEYEKALSIYQELYEKHPNNLVYFQGLIAVYQELGQYANAIKLLMQKTMATSNYPNLLVELGYNYQLQGNLEAAKEQYEKAISKISERPNFAYSVGNAFQKHNLLEQAAKTYEIANEIRPSTNFSIQLARIYGEQGKTEKMFVNYLRLIEENPNLFFTVNRVFNQYITENPENEANQIFRKLLLKKLQANPDLLYNQLLSWLFVQQKDYEKAFVQEKAIYIRSENGLRSIFDLALIAKEEKKLETATEILNYLIENEITVDGKLRAHGILMNLKVENATEKEHSEIETDFQQLFSTYGKNAATFPLQIEYANFMAFHQDKKQEAIALLKKLLEENLNKFDQAKAKIKLADILVLNEQFNQALIYYSQVQKLVKNDVLAQKAQFKVAKTSYYKGDFDWAETQLDVLKTSTSQLIANDAMELSLLIKDNSLEDSTQTALKLFAKADLFTFQEKNEMALSILDEILEKHQNEKIIDDALFRKGKILEKNGEYEKAATAYQQIIDSYKDGILADNAYFSLAELYRKHLDQPQKAKENYEQILFNHEDSIYFVEARKRFRELRGDVVE